MSYYELFNYFLAIPLEFDCNSRKCHNILIKEHAVRKQDDDKPFGRTLFVLNIPPYATKSSLKRVFSAAGAVESVILCTEEGHGFKTGYIVFTKPSSLINALSLTKLPPLSTNKYRIRVGLKKYIREYNQTIVDPAVLQKEIDTFMLKFDAEEEEKRNAKEQEVDEEGWTVVTKKGKNPGLSRKESVQNKITEKLQKKKEKYKTQNFYKFQIRESKMNHIVQLREKFEEDKKRIEAFKKSRKFKPF